MQTLAEQFLPLKITLALLKVLELHYGSFHFTSTPVLAQHYSQTALKTRQTLETP